MSTRANIVIKTEDTGRTKYITLYQHSDGYPSYILPKLSEALKLAWPLPRFDGKDYAAAVVATFKTQAGGMYIDGTSTTEEAKLHGDIDYWYLIEHGPLGLSVTVNDTQARTDEPPDALYFDADSPAKL